MCGTADGTIRTTDTFGVGSRAPLVTLAEKKRAVRRTVAECVMALDPTARIRADDAISSAILGLSEYHECEQVLSYVPLKDEVDVAGIGRSAVEAGKALYLPTTLRGCDLEYRRWRPGDVLVRGERGVLEPTTGDRLLTARALILVPGRAFSLDGWRLGRGGGYYDRALRRLSPIGTTVGVAYQCQVLPDLPRGFRDERVDRVVTELARESDFR
jgi:5-formyltetrahydrofolate cyclo-ligase